LPELTARFIFRNVLMFAQAKIPVQIQFSTRAEEEIRAPDYRAAI
jgi:hypothetical protein